MRSRIAVTATLPVPYRVLRLASAMTAGVDCRCFVVPCCSSCRFLFFRSEPREEPIRAYSCNSWYNIFVPSYARNPICCPLLFFVVLVVVFIFFIPSPARNLFVQIGYAELKVRVIRGKSSSFRAPRGTICCPLLSFVVLVVVSSFSFRALRGTLLLSLVV